ncbi:hypothetical protein IV203_034340 [Nitzschia inconspicua]|uniref:Uncharacterized protein n=1 Tax=Nitzschia inconspicua TaxID=303405 RepID=A0A9K3Q7H4_9STRA|nr:hypothetical protein IV203_034340 [Nitzschia inconspicua]
MMMMNTENSFSTVDTVSSFSGQANEDSTTSVALNPTIPSRRYGRRIKMQSDISGMFLESMEPSSSPSFSSLHILPSFSSSGSMASFSLTGAPDIPTTPATHKHFPVSTEMSPFLSPARRLRQVKRRLLLQSVIQSTSEQMAALQSQQLRSERFGSLDSQEAE